MGNPNVVSVGTHSGGKCDDGADGADKHLLSTYLVPDTDLSATHILTCNPRCTDKETESLGERELTESWDLTPGSSSCAHLL